MREEGFAELSANERAALLLAADHSYDEIGRKLGVTKSAIAQRMLSAKAKLSTNDVRGASRRLREIDGWGGGGGLNLRTGTNDQLVEPLAEPLESAGQSAPQGLMADLFRLLGERNQLTKWQRVMLSAGVCMMSLLLFAMVIATVTELGWFGHHLHEAGINSM